MIANTSFNFPVAKNAILYILSKFSGELDKHKVSKILYYADQEHLSLYGRQITGDTYIAMAYGPVPSKILDIWKALSGDSYFSNLDEVKDLAKIFKFKNSYVFVALVEPDMDYLSETDVECLDKAIDKCKDKSFNELATMTHSYAWGKTAANSVMTVKDILEEAGDDFEYIDYIQEKMMLGEKMWI